MKKRDALDRLMEHCTRLVTLSIPQPIEGEHIQPAMDESTRRIEQTKRLVRALLRERADAVTRAWAAGECSLNHMQMYDTIRAAVLSRPKRSGK